MKIVISGYYGFDNIGDEAIVYSIIQSLRTVKNDVEIIVLSNNPDKTEKLYRVKSVNRWELNEVKKAIKSADGLISGGGSLFQDSTGWKSIPYYGGIIKIAQWYRKPVFVYAQGMGPFNLSISKKIVRHVMNKSDMITVRDLASKQLLEEIGVKRHIEIVPDPVIGFELKPASGWYEEQEFTKPVVTVSVRNWKSNEQFKKTIAAELDRLKANNNVNIVFVPMHGEHDRVASQDVIDMMEQPALVAPYDASIEEKISIIGKSSLLLGMRLHSLIFAAVTHTPFIAISYDPKIDAFAEMCKQPNAGHVDFDDLTGISKLISESLNRKSEQSERMRETVNNMKNKALDTAQKAIDTFQS